MANRPMNVVVVSRSYAASLGYTEGTRLGEFRVRVNESVEGDDMFFDRDH